jgi:hypothetical protein
MNMREAIIEILTRAPSVAHEAARTLQAPEATRQMRYNALVISALRDPEAHWTPEEQEALLAHYEEMDETRTAHIGPFRVSPSERIQIEANAQRAGVSVSEWIRRRAAEEE